MSATILDVFPYAISCKILVTYMSSFRDVENLSLTCKSLRDFSCLTNTMQIIQKNLKKVAIDWGFGSVETFNKFLGVNQLLLSGSLAYSLLTGNHKLLSFSCIFYSNF